MTVNIHELFPNNVAFIGDVHMEAQATITALKYASNWHHADVAVQVGDFGWNLDAKFLKAVEEYLQIKNMYLFYLPGNHEDYNKLYSYPLDEFGTRPITERIINLPRGFRWNWNGVDYMALGGAHSIDKLYRKTGGPNQTWWPQERITDEEAAYASREGNVDIMLTHDCPTGINIPGITKGDTTYWPKVMVDESNASRDTVRRVVDAVRPKRLICGHYHVRHTDKLLGYNYMTIVDILDRDYSPVHKNVVGLDDLNRRDKGELHD